MWHLDLSFNVEWHLTHSGSGVVLCWFSNPALAPAGFKFINPARSGSGWIWKIGIRYIPNIFYSVATIRKTTRFFKSHNCISRTCKLYKLSLQHIIHWTIMLLGQCIVTFLLLNSKYSFYLLWKHIKVGACCPSHAKFGCLEAPQNVLQCCSNEEVLLLQTQLFAFKELHKVGHAQSRSHTK